MSTRFFTNRRDNTLLEKFAGVFANNPNLFTIPQASLRPDGWQLERKAVVDLLDKLRASGKPLGDYVEGRFYYGIKTGLNEAFVVDRATRDQLIAEHPSSAEILKPFLRGRDVKRWQCHFADQYLIKIESSENKRHPWSDLPSAKAEKCFASTYPAINAHFKPMRDMLIARTDQGRFFWELRSCIYWDAFDECKIIYPDIYEHQSFAWDAHGLYSVNTTCFIPTNEKWLVAVLNSATVEWYYSRISNKIRGGYLRAFSDYVSLIPIPAATSEQQATITDLVDRILAAKAADPAADVSALESEIDHLVHALYHLTPEEIAIVEGRE